ncbi:MAG: amino acid ABC transporter substrate-binding protein [Clostridium sp.]|uniref:amino acid ABC transporter substrate-binding protein n=1 Tax=Clostridium sp. TaxID=1506 RepID=UPI001EC0DB6E|nr:amino acid ABC transporter substrate-binding protein [Clostridium sp.]MBS5885084.1 amino acid ABC transporter substrate-binding protein [Clostridium sp.]MDU7148580.1 amino acid ABC transporter substrate-binding protein [Clostridium sp.]MDU7241869.1 amino acid ABC transporter substrate-binding protein [Clostridium sp.]
MKIIKRLLITLLLGVMSLALVSCGEKKIENSMEKEELVLGFDDTFVPMGFKDKNGEYTGFDIELAKGIGEKLNKKIIFQPIDWSMKETELNNGNIDFIWNGYSITEERKEKVAFSKEYLNNRQVIITLANSKINSKKELKDAVVAAQNQSSAVDAIEADGDIVNSFKDGKIVTFETNNEALMDLEAGRVDAVVADEILAKYYINQRGAEKYKVLDEDFGKESYAVGMRKDDKVLVEAFNKAFDELVNEGKAADISEKWFGEDIIAK